MRVDRVINSIFFSNTFVIHDNISNEVWLVDCGDIGKILSMLSNEEIITSVLLTHAHSDHIYGLNDLLSKYPNISIFTNSYGVDALRSPKLNLSRYHDEYPDFAVSSVDNIKVLNDGDKLLFGDSAVEVCYTPGHDPSCLTFKVGNYIFTGDAYIPGVNVCTSFPKGDKILAKQSVDKILSLIEGRIVCPGHGEMRKITHK